MVAVLSLKPKISLNIPLPATRRCLIYGSMDAFTITRPAKKIPHQTGFAYKVMRIIDAPIPGGKAKTFLNA
jgi:hypothetical protein